MRTTASVTSGPMPSPGMSVIVCAISRRPSLIIIGGLDDPRAAEVESIAAFALEGILTRPPIRSPWCSCCVSLPRPIATRSGTVWARRSRTRSRSTPAMRLRRSAPPGCCCFARPRRCRRRAACRGRRRPDRQPPARLAIACERRGRHVRGRRVPARGRRRRRPRWRADRGNDRRTANGSSAHRHEPGEGIGDSPITSGPPPRCSRLTTSPDVCRIRCSPKN